MLLLIILFLSPIAIAQEPKSYTDQDLEKYKYPGDNSNPYLYQIQKQQSKLDRLEREKEILKEIEIAFYADLPQREICLTLENLSNEYDNLIGNDKEAQARASPLKFSIRQLCKSK